MDRVRIAEHVAALYGEAAAAPIRSRVEALIGQAVASAAPAAPHPGSGLLSERDVLLITYPDQVREPGVRPLQTLTDFCEAHLRGVVSGVHVLPLYPWSSDDGFAVKDYFAVDPAFGTWEDVTRLGRSFDLMFDAVFNHLSVQSEWFQRFLRDEPEFSDFFVTVEGDPDLSQVVRPRALPLLSELATARGPRKVWTTFSADQADLNYMNPRVLLAVLDALLFYVGQGARFIRLDAVAFLWKEIGTTCLHRPETHRIIQLLRTVLDAVAPGVRLITETNVPHADNVSYFGDGTNEAQLVYNFALPPLVLHAFQTGNAETLTRWAQSLVQPSDHVTFLNFLASHDGIGLNPARGLLSDSEINGLVAHTLKRGGMISDKAMPDGTRLPYELNVNYLDALSNPEDREPAEAAARRFLTAHAILLSLQGVPALYFHSLFGSRGDRAGAEASGIPRRINREKLDRSSLEAVLADPGSLRSHVLRGFRALLRARRTHAAFAPTAPQRVLSLAPHVFAVWRADPERRNPVLCLHNVGAETRRVRTEPAGGHEDIELPPHATRWLEPRAGVWVPIASVS